MLYSDLLALLKESKLCGTHRIDLCVENPTHLGPQARLNKHLFKLFATII